MTYYTENNNYSKKIVKENRNHFLSSSSSPNNPITTLQVSTPSNPKSKKAIKRTQKQHTKIENKLSKESYLILLKFMSYQKEWFALSQEDFLCFLNNFAIKIQSQIRFTSSQLRTMCDNLYIIGVVEAQFSGYFYIYLNKGKPSKKINQDRTLFYKLNVKRLKKILRCVKARKQKKQKKNSQMIVYNNISDKPFSSNLLEKEEPLSGGFSKKWKAFFNWSYISHLSLEEKKLEGLKLLEEDARLKSLGHGGIRNIKGYYYHASNNFFLNRKIKQACHVRDNIKVHCKLTGKRYDESEVYIPTSAPQRYLLPRKFRYKSPTSAKVTSAQVTSAQVTSAHATLSDEEAYANQLALEARARELNALRQSIGCRAVYPHCSAKS